MRAVLALAVVALAATPALAQDPSGEPANGSVTLAEGFPDDPFMISLFAGGPVASEAPGCTVEEIGFVGSSPDLDLYYDSSGATDLFFFAGSAEDTTLLVRIPDGSWWCDDDTDGFNPLVHVADAEGGLYSIWVGAWGDTAEAELFVTEIDPR